VETESSFLILQEVEEEEGTEAEGVADMEAEEVDMEVVEDMEAVGVENTEAAEEGVTDLVAKGNMVLEVADFMDKDFTARDIEEIWARIILKEMRIMVSSIITTAIIFLDIPIITGITVILITTTTTIHHIITAQVLQRIAVPSIPILVATVFTPTGVADHVPIIIVLKTTNTSNLEN
jgi:hypothetical protein